MNLKDQQRDINKNLDEAKKALMVLVLPLLQQFENETGFFVENIGIHRNNLGVIRKQVITDWYVKTL